VLARADNSFLTIELALLGLFLLGHLTSTGIHQAAAGLLLTGVKGGVKGNQCGGVIGSQW
jgi:hypothetical protein